MPYFDDGPAPFLRWRRARSRDIEKENALELLEIYRERNARLRNENQELKQQLFAANKANEQLIATTPRKGVVKRSGRAG